MFNSCLFFSICYHSPLSNNVGYYICNTNTVTMPEIYRVYKSLKTAECIGYNGSDRAESLHTVSKKFNLSFHKVSLNFSLPEDGPLAVGNRVCIQVYLYIILKLI